MKQSVAVFLLMLFILLVGCSNQNTTTEKDENIGQDAEQTHDMKPDILATNLKVPWNIAKQGENFFISERPGNIVKVNTEGEMKNMPLSLEKDVVQEGEGGLLGFVLTPDFETSRLAFIYHTYKEKGGIYNRVVKIKLSEKAWKEQAELLDHIPASSIHNGGRLKIGPDDKLYALAGDASVEENAQDRDSLSGKILRINLDGSVPENNPFPDSYVYSYGHRNPQGLVWTNDETFFSAEHGSSAHDEINRIEIGNNYGWPVIRGNETKEGMEAPLFQSKDETWAPSGMAYAKNEDAEKGTLFIAGLRGSQIRAFNLANNTSKIVFSDAGRLRDILIQEGYAYVITSNTDGRGNPGPNDDRLLRFPLEDLLERAR